MTGNPAAHPTIAGCVHVLDSCIRAVKLIPADVYARKDGAHESIGAHFRHSIEHIQCFLAGIDEGVINYDLRVRDEVLETCPQTFAQACTNLIAELRGLEIADFDAPLIVRQLPGPDSEPLDVTSSPSREIIFLSSHLIHHISVIQIYCRESGVELPKGINLAFSTVAYRKKRVAG